MIKVFLVEDAPTMQGALRALLSSLGGFQLAAAYLKDLQAPA